LIELQEKKLREQGDSLLGMSQFEDLFGVGMMIIIIFLIWLGHAIKKKTEIQKKILRELSKMELLEEMAAQMAHEINNPLAIIRAKSSQLRRLITSGRYESGHAIIFLQEIEDMSVRISKIVNGLKTSPKPTEKS
jgi:C4-dicarboxylate-specific signal transduction histidine kinase